MVPRIAPLDPPYPAALQAQFDKLMRGAPFHDTSRVDGPLWTELSGHFAPDQLVELIVLAGLYHAVSFATNAIGVQHEAFAPRFPALPR